MAYWFQKIIQLKSRPQGCYLITDEILSALDSQIQQIQTGLCNLLLMHTSAGLILGENCDPTVRTDMLNFFRRMAPNEGKYQHDCEGPDDMPAHIKSALSGVSLNIPISKGHLLMGTWQGVWLMEYRTKKHAREIIATITGRKFNQS